MKSINALKFGAATIALTASFAAKATCDKGCTPPPQSGTNVTVPVTVGVEQDTTIKADLKNQQGQNQGQTQGQKQGQDQSQIAVGMGGKGGDAASQSISGVNIGKDAIKTGDQKTVVGVKTGDTNVGVKTGDTKVGVKTGDTLVKQGDQTVGPVTQKGGDVTNDNSYSNTTTYKAAAASAYAAGGPAHYSNGCNMSGWSAGVGVQTIAGGATANVSTGMHFDQPCWTAHKEEWQDAQTIASGKVGAATVIGTWIKADPAKLETAKDVAAKLQANPHQQDPLALLFGVQAAAPKDPPAAPEQKPTTFTNTIYVGVDGKPVTPPVCQDGSLKGKPAIYSAEAKAFICN